MLRSTKNEMCGKKNKTCLENVCLQGYYVNNIDLDGLNKQIASIIE